MNLICSPLHLFPTKDFTKVSVRLCLLLIVSLLSNLAHANINNTGSDERKSFAIQQEKAIKGKVTDEKGEALPGVSVIVKGSEIGTITDLDGNYSVSVPDGQNIIIFSFVGMQTQEIEISDNLVINIVLQPNLVDLDEVIVVGYGTQRKSDLTGAISSVSADKLSSMPSLSVGQALQGRAAGIQVIQNTGAPGAGITVKIRGTGTINNSNPLYIVDGFSIADIDQINVQDIKSIEILKDASACAIYGSRAANGVVLITTKSGGIRTKPTINYSGYVSFQDYWKKPDLMNAEEFGEMFSTGIGDNSYAPGSQTLEDVGNGTDWLDEISRIALMQKHNLTLSGNGENVNYYISGNLQNQEGIVKETDYKFMSFRSNIDFKINSKLTLSTKFNISKSNRHYVDATGGIISDALKSDPVTTIYDLYSIRHDFAKLNESGRGQNPVSKLAHNYKMKEKSGLIGNLALKYKLNEDLKFESRVGISNSLVDDHQFDATYQNESDIQNNKTTVIRDISKLNDWSWENILFYTKEIKEKHNLNITVGTALEESNSQVVYAERQGTPGNEEYLQFLDLGYVNDKARGNYSSNSLQSFFGRVFYNIDNRYLITANFRADGSSKFAKGNKWGFFPSASLAWKMSEENFLKDIRWLQLLKVRGGWGQLGNNRIASNAYFTEIGTQKDYTLGESKTLVPGMAPTSIGNPNISWETTTSTNFGADVTLFQGKINFTLDYFIKNTIDMLQRLPIAPSMGIANSPYQNAGDVLNKGFEITFNHKNMKGDFSYDFGFNISRVKNNVVDLFKADIYSANINYLGGNVSKTEANRSIAQFFGWVTDGIFQSDEQAANYTWSNPETNEVQRIQPVAMEGAIRFKDLNDDGVINDKDRGYIGNPHPDYTFGVNANLGYKNFDFQLFLQGTQGNELFNCMDFYLMSFTSRNTNGHYNSYSSFLDDAWTSENQSNTIPRIQERDDNYNYRISDFYIQDGSYIRVKNIKIGYTLPEDLCNKLNIGSLKLSIVTTNSFTFTKYTGLDPEIGRNGGNLDLGIDRGTYPQARSFILELNLTF